MSDLATTVLVPTLWRAGHIGPFLESLYANAGPVPVRPLFLCDEDDAPTLVEVDRHGADHMVFPGMGGKPMSMVAKCNAAFAQVTTPYLFGASDDIRFLPGCLEACHEALTDPHVEVACVSDGIDLHLHDGELTGHCLVRCSYIRERSGTVDTPGVLMHPGYQHYYSDVEFWEVARSRGVYRSCFEARIDHPHPNNGTAKRDATHRLSLEVWREDRATYLSRRHLWQNLTVPA